MSTLTTMNFRAERRSRLGRIALSLLNKNTPLTASERESLKQLTEEMEAIEPEVEREARALHSAAFEAWLRRGVTPSSYQSGISADQRSILQQRDMVLGGQGGAYPGSTTGFFAPVDFAGQVESALKSFSGIFQSATIQESTDGRLTAHPLDDDTSQTGELVPENVQVTDVDIAGISQKIIGAFKYSSKLIKVSVENLRDAGFDISGYISGRLGVRLGRVLNDHLTNGSGSGQPTGLLQAASVGHVATGAAPNTGGSDSTNTLGTGDFAALEKSVDPAYRGVSKWMMHSDVLASCRALLSKQGNVVFEGLHSSADGEDRIFNRPVVINNNFPTLQSGPSSPPVTVTGTVAYGDFSRYLIRRGPFYVQRLDERFIDQGLVGFVAIVRVDGNLLHPAAVRLMSNSL